MHIEPAHAEGKSICLSERLWPVICGICSATAGKALKRVATKKTAAVVLMRMFLLGLLIGLILIPLAVWVYFRFGFAPVATAAGAMPFEKYLARVALHTRIDREAPKSSPLLGNDANYEAGAHVYREQCALCHGLPNQPEPFIGTGEYPHPPQLFKGHGVTDDPAGETYWKVSNSTYGHARVQ